MSGQYMRHLSESTTCLDVQGLFAGLGEYDTCFDDTNSLGVGEENFGLESWNTASSKPAIVNRSQCTSECNPQFPRATNDQATISSNTNTAFPAYDFDYAIAYPHRIDEFANATPPFTYPQSLTGDITDAGFDSINQQIRRRPQLGFDERSYGQFAFRSSSRLQKPRNNIAPPGFTVPHDSAEPFLSLDRLYSAQSRLLPGLKGAPVPDMAFHAPGMAISAKTEEVLRRAVPEYKAGAPSLADKSMLSGDNSRSGDDLFDEPSSPI
ncbi:uncharacterized protein J4E78_007080 [Alternaria triticimaculans]|uniref:uncharacterized protein n=1 Tax=Alternaria triticimaculans TaxID=297637 RepID=UPI0020C24262|nr:uncharacterized protein J4E78_007080 [Alternaria triticimaculans]KAI4654901.1 hypothetical protein J4E78_007080 [Alternaria triticimaculans]